MANVLDVAKYILLNEDGISTFKLQKLVYYAQAWSVTLNQEPLFPEKVLAWENGPVVKELFLQHKKFFTIHFDDLEFGDADNLTVTQKNLVDRVLAYYGNMKTDELVALTHKEDPWKHADEEISIPAMIRYYEKREPITQIQVPEEVDEWIHTLPASSTVHSA